MRATFLRHHKNKNAKDNSNLDLFVPLSACLCVFFFGIVLVVKIYSVMVVESDLKMSINVPSCIASY